MTEADKDMERLGYHSGMGDVPDELEILAEQLPKPNDLIDPAKQALKDNPAIGVGLAAAIAGGAVLYFGLHKHKTQK